MEPKIDGFFVQLAKDVVARARDAVKQGEVPSRCTCPPLMI
jgi:hypothetical protein